MQTNTEYYLWLVQQSMGKECLATEEIERDLHRFDIQSKQLSYKPCKPHLNKCLFEFI